MATMSQVGMEHLIQFRSLLDSLSHAEYYELVANLMKQNKELFASLLFKHFMHTDPDLDTSDQIVGKPCINMHALNSKIIKIINDRPPEPHTAIAEQLRDVSLDHLPDDMIAKISSNLCLDDYIQLEQTNRRMFIIMRSKPLALSSVTLNAKQFENYSLYVFDKTSKLSNHRFEAIQNAEIPNMNPSKMINVSRWTHLRSLKLYDDGFQNNAYDDLAIHFESITHLHVDAIIERYSQEQLLTFLQKCIHLEYLSFPGFSLLSSWDGSPLYPLEWMKQIKGLRTEYAGFACVLDLWQHQLESLHLYGDALLHVLNAGLRVKQYTFPHLKELCLAPIPPEDAERLQRFCNFGCKKLERLHIGFDCGTFPVNYRTALECLFSLESLNYLSLHVEQNIKPENVLEQILEVLIKSLLSGSKPRMKIRIDPGLRHLPCDDKKMDEVIMKLIDTANAHITKDWMFIFDYARMSIKDTKGVQELVQWTRKMNRKLNNRYFFTLNHKYCQNLQSDILEPDMQLIISNYECGINGYKEKWIYDYGCVICSHCTV